MSISLVRYQADDGSELWAAWSSVTEDYLVRDLSFDDMESWFLDRKKRQAAEEFNLKTQQIRDSGKVRRGIEPPKEAIEKLRDGT